MSASSGGGDPRPAGPTPAHPKPLLSESLDRLDDLVASGTLRPPSCLGVRGELGRFRVLRLLGEGGMAVVVLAQDPRSGAFVAIKMLKDDLAMHPAAVERFHKEAERMSRLSYPRIIPVLERSNVGEPPFYVMPYERCGSLAQRLGENRPLDDCMALEVAFDVAGALEYAHKRHGLLHCDVKPENILLDPDGHACLADFGLGFQLGDDWLPDGQRQGCVGTAPYMSPGTAENKREDIGADIYALGAVLYAMLTGVPPYEGRDTAEIIRKILESPPAPIFKKRPEAPSGLATVADGAMARELRDRYACWADLIEDLHRVERQEFPLGPRGRRRRPTRRVLLFSAGTSLLLAGAAIGVPLARGWITPAPERNGVPVPPPVPEVPQYLVQVAVGATSLAWINRQLPVRGNTPFRIQCDVPTGANASIFWYDSQGELVEMEVANRTPLPNGLRDRLVGRDDLYLDDSSAGMNVVVVCADTRRKPACEDVKSIFHDTLGQSSPPQLPSSIVVIMSDGVQIESNNEKSRGFRQGIARNAIFALEERFERLRQQLRIRYDFIAGVAFWQDNGTSANR